MKKRLLTKSRFKIGHECPTKLFYWGKPEYGNNRTDNAFLQALAEGGFQVGELAKHYHPDGVEIRALENETAVIETEELLKKDSITLFEPAIQIGDFLVRVDILIKKGNSFELIEVKAKSFDSREANPFFKRRSKENIKEISSSWEPYIIDVAFQTLVLKKRFPKATVRSFLMLADRSKKASIDGLNQKFFLASGDTKTERVVVAKGITKESLGEPLLVKVNVDAEVETICDAKYLKMYSFEDYAQFLADAYVSDRRLSSLPGQQCKTCELRIDQSLLEKGLKSAFEECWTTERHLRATDLKRPLVFDLWNFRKSKKLIEDGCLFVDELNEEDVGPKDDTDAGLSLSQRQWLQAEKIIKGDHTPFIDIEGIQSEMLSWEYPLHFIDFETTMVAIPFNKGRRPYEQMAFQFSHHIVTKEGKIEHRTEYINRTRGSFPNFEFVRELKKALSSEEGTIFRYASHENTVLCQILNQLEDSEEPDREELINWIKTITKAPEKSENAWIGHRCMVDMRTLVLRYFFHPRTKGSNSIKDVLRAVLNESNFIKKKYSSPCYGSTSGIKSLNFKDWQWVQTSPDGSVADPYSLLEPIFEDINALEAESVLLMLDEEHRISDGGAAMTAYARMQFTEMSQLECERICKALLRYCELDTFAMVLIYEYWKHEVDSKLRSIA